MKPQELERKLRMLYSQGIDQGLVECKSIKTCVINESVVVTLCDDDADIDKRTFSCIGENVYDEDGYDVDVNDVNAFFEERR